jgi:hypothetical protein
VKSESLARGGVMTMTPTDNLVDDDRLQRCVCLCVVVVFALATVVFHDGYQGCLYQFLVGFPLSKWPSLFFFLIKKMTNLLPDL